MTLQEALRILRAAGLVARTPSDLGEEPNAYEVAWDAMRNAGPLGEAGVRRGDPRYLGCALALLREAVGDPSVYVRRLHLPPSNPSNPHSQWPVVWSVRQPKPDGSVGIGEAATEGDAVHAALCAIATRVRR